LTIGRNVWAIAEGDVPGKSNGPAPAITKTLAGAAAATVVVLAVAG